MRVIEWTREVRVGGDLIVTFEVVPPNSGAQVVEIRTDLEGDGRDGWPITGRGLERIRQVVVKPELAGTFQLEVSVLTEEGCRDVTGTKRPVKVTKEQQTLRCAAFATGQQPPKQIDQDTLNACAAVVAERD